MMNKTFSADCNQRYPAIPIEYLVSEIAAFPLVSVSAFTHNVLTLDPEMSKATGELWRAAERHLTHIGPDLSIDMLLAIRDHFWFAFESRSCRNKKLNILGLDNYLKRLTKEFFELRGSHAAPRSPASELIFEREKSVSSSNRNNKTLRWLSYSLPVDLLLGSSDCNTCPPNRVEYASPQMYQNLKDQGLIEPHLHVGAAMQFSEFWVAVLNRLASNELGDEAFKSPGAEMKEGRHLVPWLLRAAVARLFLARFLYTNHHCLDGKLKKRKFSSNFENYFNNIVLKEIAARRGSGFAETVRRALRELQAGEFFPHDGLKLNAFLRSCYREMVNPQFILALDDRPENVHLCDPIASLTRYAPCNSPQPEICFVHKAINYLSELHQEGKKDKSFESLFWQVVRMRCLLYRHVTQRPMTPGLLWFVRHYDRMSPGRRNADLKLLVRSAALNCGLERGLRALEVRTSPEKNIHKMLQLAQDSVEALRYWHFPRYLDTSFRRLPYPFQPGMFDASLQESAEQLEFGWIIHFVKLRGDDSKKGLDKPWWRLTNADPKQPIKKPRSKLTQYWYQYRYADYYRKRKKEAMVLGKLMLNYPRSLKVVRGIDCCTDELGVPGWVLAPIFRYLTDAGKAASQHLKARFGEEVPPLRKTVHVGEDFPHLLGGLRRIDEAVRFLKLSAGDRIGHGMALGTDPETWARRTGRVAMRLEDRLFDLLWEWSQNSTHVISCSSGRFAYVEREIARLSDKIFGESQPPYKLEKLIANLYDENMLKAIGYPEEVHYRVRPKIFSKDLKNNIKLLKKQLNENDQDLDLLKRYLDNNIELLNKRIKENDEDLDILKRYLKDPDIFKRGQDVEWFSVIPEIETMTALQNYLRETIGSLGLVVEVNPSSNLLIGNVADLRNHPLWRLDSPLGEDDVPPVALCIGSDDPLTFATDLRREYALVYESLIDGGLSAAQAWEWVNKVRRTGMNSRFTLPVEEPQKRSPKVSFSYKEKYRVTDSQMPRSYWVLGLGKDIRDLP